MRFLFPFVLILLFIFRNKLKKGTRASNDANRLFWQRESESNSVRRKDIEQLNYITIPEKLPHIDTDNLKIMQFLKKLEDFRSKKCLNLTGISNTDIKMEYGVANLPILSEYDDNFAELVKLIAGLGHELIEEGMNSEALFFLEFGIDCGSDISSNYIDLAKLYKDAKETSKIEALLKKANQLNSLSKAVITQKLQALV